MALTVRLRVARVSTAMCFGLTGFTFATWAARIPARKADLGISDAELSWAFAALNAGAVLGLQVGAMVVTRFGSRLALTLALPIFAAMLVPLALAPNLGTLMIFLAVSAAANSVVDVAINDQGVVVQHRYGRSLLSGLHALHSIGGVTGGLVAVLAAHLRISVITHFTIVTIAVCALGLGAVAGLVPRPADHSVPNSGSSPLRSAITAGWTRRLMLLGALAFVFTAAEGSALDWAAVLLHDHRNATPATAAAGVTVFQAAVAAGRLSGDRLIDRAGPIMIFRISAIIAGAGFVAGLLIATAWAALAGLALFGLGLATLLPIVISAAGRSDTPTPTAIARVSSLGYLGSFTGPLVIGGLSRAVGLPSALLLPAVAVAGTTLAARTIRSRDQA